ncbi:MAG: hypothetical protein AB1938_15440 [Myxococcota bacterium]
MSATDTVVEGVVLCRVGGDRLAVLPSDVVGVELPDAKCPYAGSLFDGTTPSPADARLLRHELSGLVVDALEVHAEPLSLMRVPPALRWVVGGALMGFVQVGGSLWPVVSLPALSRHLSARSGAVRS